MSATIAAHRVYEAFLGPDLGPRTLYHGHSYGGNALAAAVGLRHLQLLQSTQVLSNVHARSEQLAKALAQNVRPHRAVRDIRLIGLMGAVELDTDNDPGLARRAGVAMVKRGVLSRSMGPVLTVVPPLTITATEIDRIVTTMAEALGEVAC
jgi:adenosylmethionine-8-amino-7-oxononanoate aminotransferase